MSYADNDVFIRYHDTTSDFFDYRIWAVVQAQYLRRVYQGAKDGFETVIGIMPTLIGLMVAVGILRASGFLECFSNVCAIFTEKIGFPSELLPLAVVKMFSSSAATGLLLDIYKEYGTDSLLGRMASIMLGSTETIFYTMSVYFMSVKIKKSRYTLAGALAATAAGMAASVVLAGMMGY